MTDRPARPEDFVADPRSDYLILYQDKGGEWRWRRRAANHETISDSGEGYTTKLGAVVAAIRANGEELELKEQPAEGED